MMVAGQRMDWKWGQHHQDRCKKTMSLASFRDLSGLRAHCASDSDIVPLVVEIYHSPCSLYM
jgi:hypothetical protein